MPKWLIVARKVLGAITDVLTAGRSAGLWSEKQGGAAQMEKPHRPEGFRK